MPNRRRVAWFVVMSFAVLMTGCGRDEVLVRTKVLPCPSEMPAFDACEGDETLGDAFLERDCWKRQVEGWRKAWEVCAN